MIVTVKTPASTATATTGSRNCQTETPAARVTTTSFERVSRQNVAMAAKSTVKGITSWLRKGSFRNAISITTVRPTLSLVAMRSSRSTMLTRMMMPTRTRKKVKNRKMNCRAT